MRKVLSIAGSDSGGGAGIQADLKTFAACGVYGMTVITSVTAQNTLGVQGIYDLPPSFVKKQIDSVAEDIDIDAVKIGMVSNAEIIKVIRDELQEKAPKNVVLDPVMVAKSGAQLLHREAIDQLREMVSLASVVTPNIPEAELLVGMKIKGLKDAERAATEILNLGPQAVVIKGGHLPGEKADDLFYDGDKFTVLSAPKLSTKNTHGSGCSSSSAIAAYLAKGCGKQEAVKQAKEFITAAIRGSFPIGRGYGPVNHLASLYQEAERYKVIEALASAYQAIEALNTSRFVPEVQSNLVFALPNATRKEEVAGFPGRIVKVGDRVERVSCPRFGGSSHLANLVLEIMQHVSSYRSAMNIKYDKEFLKRGERLGFQIEGFTRASEPKTIKEQEGRTLSWGVKAVLSKTQRIPDIIYDGGEVGKEPMIRIIGEDPGSVVEKLKNLVSD